jgi:signal transduction histidine kinase
VSIRGIRAVPQKRPAGNEATPGDEAVALARLQERLEEAADLANWLGHDFANILTGISGFAELTLSHVLPDSEAHEFVLEIQGAAERGNELVRRLLLFGRRARSQGGTSRLAVVLVQDAERWQALLGSDHTLGLDIPADAPPVGMAPEAIRTLLEPLLQNAKQAMNGPGMITVTARSVELSAADCATLLGRAKPGPFVELSVADTGSGFSPEARQGLLTKPFFSSRPRHHGLGLPIVYGICCTHGGGFRIDDNGPSGTCVRVFLPACRPVGV